jgi:hypothetical protein
MTWKTLEPSRGRRVSPDRWAISIGSNGIQVWLCRDHHMGGRVRVMLGEDTHAGELMLTAAKEGEAGSRAVNTTRGSGQYVRLSSLPGAPDEMRITTVEATRVAEHEGWRVRLPWPQ